MAQKRKPYEGVFVTVEGGEGAGKSTLSKQLVAKLASQGYSVLHTREPGGSPLSEYIRSLLLHPPSGIQISEQSELLLFLAARAQHIEEKILPALRQGQVVLCERFNDSTVAYQGGARHLGMSYVEKLCQLACQQLEPDCTLFLDLLPEEGLKRVHHQRGEPLDRVEQEKLQFHREVRQSFLHLVDEHPNRIFIVDASLSSTEVLQESLRVLKPFLL